ncbi:MAG: hypothetical protein JWO98_5474 [Frankiales bacterium]|nr:hypothetical protein [Frankiales bacterium]
MPKLTTSALTIVGGVAAALTVDHLLQKRSVQNKTSRERWRAVTVLASPDAISRDEEYPAPLQAVIEFLDVRTSPAPDGVSTELRARLKQTKSAEAGIRKLTGLAPESAIRASLRDAKQIVETGEVLRVLPRPEGHRPATPGGVLVDLAEQRAKG